MSSADLVNEKQFLAHLLEWFNFEEWALESQVLILLSQLSEVCLPTLLIYTRFIDIRLIGIVGCSISIILARNYPFDVLMYAYTHTLVF